MDWGTKISWAVAFSAENTIDVTNRYIKDFNSLIARRETLGFITRGAIISQFFEKKILLNNRNFSIDLL